MKLVQFREVREGAEFYDYVAKMWFVKNDANHATHKDATGPSAPGYFGHAEMVEIPDPE